MDPFFFLVFTNDVVTKAARTWFINLNRASLCTETCNVTQEMQATVLSLKNQRSAIISKTSRHRHFSLQESFAFVQKLFLSTTVSTETNVCCTTFAQIFW